MNAKRAKHLRALARQTAIEHTKYQPMKPIRIFGKNDPLNTGPHAIWLGQSILAHDCVRAVYQRMKREFRT